MTNARTQSGISLLIAIIITGTLLLVATAIANISYKEAVLAGENQESQYAFYAADTGAECAIYWDVKNQSGVSAFATSTSSQIHCNQDNANTRNPIPNTVGGNPNGVSQFTISFLPDPYCAIVTVTKADNQTTTIESRGYNTCDTSSQRRVERAVKVSY